MLPPVGHLRRIVERLKEHSLQMQKSVREFLTASQRHGKAHCSEYTEFLQLLIKNIMRNYRCFPLYELHAAFYIIWSFAIAYDLSVYKEIFV